MTYQGTAGGVNINNPDAYGVGFGQGDLSRALADGNSPQDIANYVYGSYGGAIGPVARAQLNQLLAQPAPPEMPELPAYQPPQISVNIPPPAKVVPAPMSIKGNASGVKKKKSKAEQAGRTSSGTNQFNRSMFITPSVAPLSNLNV